tara:strand:+ start:8544 stop:9620 length:1077 start_codon:yes stop_codon:yes gene_type:complete
MNIQEGTLQVVLAVLKVLEANYMPAYEKAGPGEVVSHVRAEEASRVISKLNSKEKEAFRTVLLSMILMTAGNVATVRNPDLYKDSAAKPLSHLMNKYTSELWRISGGLDYYIPKKKDYATAKLILPIVSSIPSSREKFLKIIKDKDLLGDPKRTAGESDIKIADVLYRGLHSMSSQVLMYLFYSKNPSWDITRSVSTSEDRNTALNFAQGSSVDGPRKEDGWRMLFTIQNDDKRGFDAGSLSFYGVENEYFLSGILRVDAIGFDMMVTDVTTGEKERIKIYRSANSDLVIDFLGSQFRGKEASNIFLSIMQDKPSENNIYDDLGRLMGNKISVFRVGKRKYAYDKIRVIYVNAAVRTN